MSSNTAPNRDLGIVLSGASIYLQMMSRKYKIRDQNKLYFVTFTVVQWLDEFSRQEYGDIFLDSIRFCQKKKGLEVCAYVITSSHIHMIIGRNGDDSLEGIIRDSKKFTSSKIIEAIKENLQESRRELLLWLFERQVGIIRIICAISSGNRITTPLS